MKTLLTIWCILTLSNGVMAQLDEPNRLLLLSKYEEAKNEIDKVLADPAAKQNPETFLLKSKIYAEVYYDSLLRTKYPESGDQAHSAIRQYVVKDPSLKSLRENNGMRAVSIVYSMKFNEGQQFFTQSKWEQALKSFAIAEDLGDFIAKNGLGRSRQNIDTLTVVYAGYAAQNAQNTTRALYYYKKFAAEKIGGQDFIEVYRYLLNASMTDRNAADFNKYLSLSKTLYPKEQSLWSAYEIEYLSKSGGASQMLSKYRTDDQNGHLGGNEYLMYAEYFVNIPAEELKKLPAAEQLSVKALAPQAFGKAFNLEKNGVYAFNAGVLLYQQYSELEDRIAAAGNTGASAKRKQDSIEAKQLQLADMSVEWLEKAYTLLKAKKGRDKSDISCLSKSVDLLAELYQWKRDKASRKNAAAYNALEVKYKQFSAEHGIYK